MVSKLSIKKRFFLYSIFCSLLGGFSFYTYLLFTAKSNFYYIDFQTSVQGLKNGCSINYKGLNVGMVEKIEFNEELDVVRLTVKIDYDFHMYADYIPTINMQGLAGVCVIELNRDPLLLHEKLEQGAILSGKASYIENLQNSLGYISKDLMSIVNVLKDEFVKDDADKFRSIINNVDRIIGDVQSITSKLAANDTDILVIIDTINECVEIFRQALERAESQKPILWRWIFGSKKSK